MYKLTASRRVTISESDYPRLKELLIDAKHFVEGSPSYIHDLEQELHCARVVPCEQVPPYVVTMNTEVRLTDAKTGKRSTHTIVFPGEANLENGKLSVLSELGAAILGHTVGDTVEWNCPDGRKCIRIDMICFQPEATKQFDL